MAHCSPFFHLTHSHWWVWQLLLVASLFWSIPLLGNHCSFFNLVQLCWLHFKNRCILCAAASQNNMLMVGCQKKMQWGFLFCKLIVSKKFACWCSIRHQPTDKGLFVMLCMLWYHANCYLIQTSFLLLEIRLAILELHSCYSIAWPNYEIFLFNWRKQFLGIDKKDYRNCTDLDLSERSESSRSAVYNVLYKYM